MSTPMSTTQALDMAQLVALTGMPPRGAGLFFADYLRRKRLSHNAAAKQMGCAASTVQRFAKGGMLTVEMAVKIHQAFAISVSMLFAMEANAMTHQAQALVAREGDHSTAVPAVMTDGHPA